MHFLYLIFSHDNREQLTRLVSAIRQLSKHSLIAIHHDPTKFTIDASLFARFNNRTPSNNIYIIPDSIRGEWGDFSLVEQYLHALNWCDMHLDFDWLITLTGFSYPIKLLDDFEAHLSISSFDAYVYHFDAFDPLHWPLGTAETRYLFRGCLETGKTVFSS